jgi:hypothetical protein
MIDKPIDEWTIEKLHAALMAQSELYEAELRRNKNLEDYIEEMRTHFSTAMQEVMQMYNSAAKSKNERLRGEVAALKKERDQLRLVCATLGDRAE